MTPADSLLAARLSGALIAFDSQHRSLPGIRTQQCRECFVAQLVESDRRVRYVATIRGRQLSPLRKDPSSDLFDPIKGAIIHLQQGDHDEASWLVFLSIHFGQARGSGWARVRDVYGALGGATWSWGRASANPLAFRTWLGSNLSALSVAGRRFGNHRKYQSLDAWKSNGTGDAVASYVSWIAPPRTHRQLFEAALQRNSGDGKAAFGDLYGSMQVRSFGRMARFDYLTMIAKVGIASIEPASTFMHGATGPLAGAQLLFGVRTSRTVRKGEIDGWLVSLARHLGVGMQVMEDAVCNWQKSPLKFKRFRG